MGESLWHDLDAWQVNIINAAMGQASEYETLQLAHVGTALVWDWKEYVDWPKPAVAVMSFSAEREPGPQGDGNANFTKFYPTVWLALVEGTQADAKRDAKILTKRLEELLRTLYQQGLTIPADDSGENLVNFRVGRSELSATRIPDSAETWMVMAGIAIRWETET